MKEDISNHRIKSTNACGNYKSCIDGNLHYYKRELKYLPLIETQVTTQSLFRDSHTGLNPANLCTDYNLVDYLMAQSALSTISDLNCNTIRLSLKVDDAYSSINYIYIKAILQLANNLECHLKSQNQNYITTFRIYTLLIYYSQQQQQSLVSNNILYWYTILRSRRNTTRYNTLHYNPSPSYNIRTFPI